MPKVHLSDNIGRRRLRVKVHLIAERASPPAHEVRAIISRRGRSVVQSGRARSQEWLLEFEPRRRQILDPLMGWSGGAEPRAQVRMSFATVQNAADRNGLRVEVRWA
jgi:hypothetical protein